MTKQSVSVIMDNSEPNSISEKSDSSESLTDTSDSIETSIEIGITNKAFVSDEELEVMKSKHQKTSSSSFEEIEISSDKDVNKASKPELADLSPRIITDISTKNGLTEEQYREYFMPVDEHKKSSRGEKLYVTKTQNCGKLCCWIISLALLAGAITVAVLIGIGVIDTDPVRQVKESRNLEIETANIEEIQTPKLLEVTDKHVPNVLTNNLAFFLSRKPNQDLSNDKETKSDSELEAESIGNAESEVEFDFEVKPESEVETVSEVKPMSGVEPESVVQPKPKPQSEPAFKLSQISESESEEEPDTRDNNSVPDTFLEFELEIIREPKTETSTETIYELKVEHAIHVSIDNGLQESEDPMFEDISNTVKHYNQSEPISDNDLLFEAEGSAESVTNIAQDAPISLDEDRIPEGSSDFLHNMQYTLGSDLDNGSGEKDDPIPDLNIESSKHTLQEMLENESLEVNDLELGILEFSKIGDFKREPFNSTDMTEVHESFPFPFDIVTEEFLTGTTSDKKNEVEDEESSG